MIVPFSIREILGVRSLRTGCRRSDPNVLLIGPPGAGTSMRARRLTASLPAMPRAEAVETTRSHGVAGLTGDRTAFMSVYLLSV
jgi:predicted ATPase with chaperone activity